MNVYTIRITNGSPSCDQYYLVCEEDYLDDICYSDHIIQTFRSYVGMYPNEIDVMEEKLEFENSEITFDEAYDIIYEMVLGDIEFYKNLATIEEIDQLGFLPGSMIYEGCEVIENYRKIRYREENINDILN